MEAETVKPILVFLVMSGIMSLTSGCFNTTQIRYVVDVKSPVSRDGPIADKRQDKGHPAVDELRPAIQLQTLKKPD